jgi:quercetin dioxygenase-like cupin family protein
MTNTLFIAQRATSLGALVLAAALAACAQPTPSVAEAPVAYTETILLTAPLGGIPGKQGAVALIDAPGGFESPMHTHPGDLFVYVVQGAVEVEFENGETQVARAGEVLHETPGNPMIGRNLSATEPVRFVVFQIADEGAPMTVAHENH